MQIKTDLISNNRAYYLQLLQCLFHEIKFTIKNKIDLPVYMQVHVETFMFHINFLTKS